MIPPARTCLDHHRYRAVDGVSDYRCLSCFKAGMAMSLTNQGARMTSLVLEFGELAGQPITLNSARRMVAIIGDMRVGVNAMADSLERELLYAILESIAHGFKQSKALACIAMGMRK